MSIVIKIDSLYKQYRLGVIGHGTLREDFQSWCARVRGKEDPNEKIAELAGGQSYEDSRFWALQGITFEVNQGERLGIIGLNGAGKSTLLKILSRVTAPTKGEVRIKGRISSLLEVGTGFHPELTGRENIYLNGTILGMRRDEINRNFDEIVDFSGIGKFIETPVKRYSSGMYVRLAFAVAAHLDANILLVDEVLAVGDVAFQKKCLSKMDEISKNEGKTIFFVSHNMSSILSLTSKCILLADGALIDNGSTQDVIRKYQNSLCEASLGQTDLADAEHYGNGDARFLSIYTRALNQNGEGLTYPESGCDLEFVVNIKAYRKVNAGLVAITVYDELGNRLIDANTLIKGESLSMNEDQQVSVRFTLKDFRLKPDVYTVGLWFGIINVADIDGVRYATSFKVEARREDILYTAPFPGVYACEFNYEKIS